jgi:squalene synthase HpnC
MQYGRCSALVAQADRAAAADRAVVVDPRASIDNENFPVASRLLPGRLRRDLRAVYDVARTIDSLGDEVPGDRLALLDDFEADLRKVWTAANPQRAVLQRLVPTVREHGVSMEPFLGLIGANRLDQTRACYPTWTDLREYCALSAEPVGRIVLEILDAARPDRLALSANVCTALQLLEHCQDVGEDRRRGRTYLPIADLQIYGVGFDDLDADTTGPRVRALVAHEVARAERLLGSGEPLVRSLHGAGRWAVAGYVAGGLATADALRRAEFDVLGREVVPARRDVARHALRLIGGRG